ncbi:Putative major facilitator superfamily, MFS transporter superfamily [Septoria linicola]|uniref:Major facilitator superfamily, MFS transporter superfamily n=1 Tax=Septoria linicola TaxID=215465 RepID=A0A9Q9APW5_9PEZI|nr:putative major facilitator superfamily, MFS transporter superfamily [Septoria linicola]USW50948.1 Putative major facilitator superfamily, MFS transporter superfamily [Septoria linicola]
MADHNQEKLKSAERLDRVERVNTTVQNPIAFVATVGGEKRSIDEAYEYLQHHADIIGEQNIDIARLRRKVDYRLMPIMYLIFGLQFLDKFLLNYAIVMGLPQDLKLKGNQLNNIASALWWAYLPMSPIVGFIVNKAPLGKWLGGNMFCWGIVIACTAAVKSYPQLIIIRVLMGIFDAAIPPSLMLISSQYYRKDEQAARFAIWFSSVGMGYILGGLISFGFQHVHTETLESWRIMFLVLGLISLIIGILCVIFMPDSPMRAKFLTDAEKTALIHHVSVNQTGITGHKIEWHQVRELFFDPQIWIIGFLSVLISCGSGILTIYATTIIKGFGFTSKEAALLNMPGGFIAIVSTLGAAVVIRYHLMQRWAISVVGYCLSLTGACLVAFAPHNNRGAQLAGIYMVSFSIFTTGIKYQWTVANIAGHTKRSLATALMSGSFAIGNICAPYAIQMKDAPHFQTGKDILVSTKAAAILIICALALYYFLVNKRRDRLYGKPGIGSGLMDSSAPMRLDDSSETWENLTDKERKSFRYVY